jgi:hypothetical protein
MQTCNLTHICIIVCNMQNMMSLKRIPRYGHAHAHHPASPAAPSRHACTGQSNLLCPGCCPTGCPAASGHSHACHPVTRSIHRPTRSRLTCSRLVACRPEVRTHRRPWQPKLLVYTATWLKTLLCIKMTAQHVILSLSFPGGGSHLVYKHSCMHYHTCNGSGTQAELSAP